MQNRSLTLALCSLFVGCSGKSEAGGPGRAEAEGPRAWDGMRAHFDLLAHAHLADVEHGGLVIDFGTPARHKYTAGGWKTSWDGDTDQAGVTFTYATSNSCRLYFPVARAQALQLRFRMKPLGSRTMSVYLNNEPVEGVTLQAGEFKEYAVEVPAERVRAGENYLLLRFNGTTPVGRWQAAAAVDWLHVVPKDGPTPPAPTLYGELVGDMNVGSESRRVVAIHPGMTLRYHVEVPQNAKLGFGLGLEGSGAPADVKVVITPEGGAATKVFERRISAKRGAEWHDEAPVDLSRFAGQLVRIDLETRGAGGDRQRVGWSTPALLVPPRERAVPRPAPAKNVIVLLIDTLRADHLSAFAKTRVKTPAFERFAREGVVFEQAQSQESWTKPSVATLLTGLYPDSHNTKTFDARLPESVTMLSEVFRDQGVRTGTILANGYVSDKFGFNQGWEHYTNFIRENRPTQAQHVLGASIDWIREHRNERFFLYVQTIDPHVPYDPPADFLRMYDAGAYEGMVVPRATGDLLEDIKRKRTDPTGRDRQRLEALYDGEISYHDRYFALLLDRLREWKLLDDTLIVVTSDHGEEFFEHGSVGHGHSLYQELLHVPLVARYPRAIHGGQRVASPVGVVDVMPTVLDLAGLETPEEVEGHSLMGAVHGEPPACPPLEFSYFLDDRRAARASRWKMVYKGASTELFDLALDPGERRDVADAHPIALRYMRAMLGQFLGAPNKREWCAASREAEPVRRHEAENAEIDEATRGQLRALGYAAE